MRDPLKGLRQIEIDGGEEGSQHVQSQKQLKNLSVTQRHLPLYEQEMIKSGLILKKKEPDNKSTTQQAHTKTINRIIVDEEKEQQEKEELKRIKKITGAPLEYNSSFTSRPLIVGRKSITDQSNNKDNENKSKALIRPRTAPSTSAAQRLEISKAGSDSLTSLDGSLQSKVGQSLFQKAGLPLTTVTSASKSTLKRPSTSSGRINQQKELKVEIDRITASDANYRSLPLPIHYKNPTQDLSIHNFGPHVKVKGFCQRPKKKKEKGEEKMGGESLISNSDCFSDSTTSFNGNKGEYPQKNNISLSKFFSPNRGGPGMVNGSFSFSTKFYNSVSWILRKQTTIIATDSEKGTTTILMTCSPSNLSIIITEINSTTNGAFSFTTQDGPVPRSVAQKYEPLNGNSVASSKEGETDDDQPWYYCYTCNPGGGGDDILLNGFCKKCAMEKHNNHDVKFTAFVVRDCPCLAERNRQGIGSAFMDKNANSIKKKEAIVLGKKKKRMDTLEEKLVNELIKSAQKGSQSEVEALIAEGAQINGYYDGTTAVHAAAKTGQKHIVKLLLQVGCSKILKDKNNKTPFDIALESYKQAIASKASEGYLDRYNICVQLLDTASPFQSTVDGNLNRLMYLLEFERLDVNMKNSYNMSLLHLACMKDHVEIVKWLMLQGADSSVENNIGQKPEDINLENRFIQYAIKVGRRHQNNRKIKEKRMIALANKAAKESLAAERLEVVGRSKSSVLQESKDRHAKRFNKYKGELSDSDRDFYLKFWPQSNDSRFDLWSRANFGTGI